MHRHWFIAVLIVLPSVLGCGGGAIAPATVGEDERQQMAEQEKSVEAEERAHQAQNK